MFIIALIVFMGFYNQCYKEADLLSEYKVVLPGWLMKIFSFPANVCRNVPLLKRLMPKERVYDISIYHVPMLTYAMVSVITTNVFYLLEDDFMIFGAWFCVWLFVAAIIFVISIICDIYFKQKNVPFKVFLAALGMFGALLIFLLCKEAAKAVPEYVWTTLIGTIVAYIVIFKNSYVEPVDGRYIKYTIEDGLLKINCGKRKIDIPLEKITKVVISGRITFFESYTELVSMALNGEEIGVAQELVEKYYCQAYEMVISDADDWRQISFAELEQEVERQKELLDNKLAEYQKEPKFELIGKLEQPHKLWAGYSISGQKDGEPVKIYMKKDEMEWKTGTAVALPLIFKKNIEESVLVVYKECEKYMDEQFKSELEYVRENSFEANARRNKYSKWGILLIVLELIALIVVLFVEGIVAKVAILVLSAGIWGLVNHAAKNDMWHMGVLAWTGIMNIMLTFGALIMMLA